MKWTRRARPHSWHSPIAKALLKARDGDVVRLETRAAQSSWRSWTCNTCDRLNAGGQAMKMLQEFKSFAMKGNVVDLAVGVIIGVAFGKISPRW